MDFLKNRYIYLWISITALVISIFFLFFGKYNLSIDMTWGINIEYSYSNNINIDEVKNIITEETEKLVKDDWNKVVNNVSVYSITWEKAFSVVVWFDSQIDEKELDALKLSFRSKAFSLLKQTDDSIVETKYVNIGKTFWDYIRKTAILTLAIAAISITIYLSYAFSWVVSWINVASFSVITLITLLHDVLIAAWLYIIIWYFFKDFQIDTFFVTALLTVLWYTINNTIVIFDRIRLNLREFAWKPGKKWKELYEIINMSIDATLTRSLYTSSTLLFVLLTVFFFWPESLSGFILVMIFWTIIGTFSSIFIAPALMFELNKNKKLHPYVKKKESIEDKIVV